jgi:hypothetical protein
MHICKWCTATAENQVSRPKLPCALDQLAAVDHALPWLLRVLLA